MRSTMCCEKQMTMKITYIDTLLIALPIKVEMKNTLNGTWRCPHVRPAKSKSGLGIYEINKMVSKIWDIILTEAAIVTVTKALRLTNSNNLNLALSIKPWSF